MKGMLFILVVMALLCLASVCTATTVTGGNNFRWRSYHLYLHSHVRRRQQRFYYIISRVCSHNRGSDYKVDDWWMELFLRTG